MKAAEPRRKETYDMRISSFLAQALDKAMIEVDPKVGRLTLPQLDQLMASRTGNDSIGERLQLKTLAMAAGILPSDGPEIPLDTLLRAAGNNPAARFSDTTPTPPAVIPAIAAKATTIDKVEPHAAAMESCAAAMEADNIGLATPDGHAATLRRWAASMRADAAVGKMPHALGGMPMYAATKPEPTTREVRLAALEAAMANMATAPEAPPRKRFQPEIERMLARAGLTAPSDDQMIPVYAVDRALAQMNLPTHERMQIKAGLRAGGVISYAG